MPLFSGSSDKNALPPAPPTPSAPRSKRPSNASVVSTVHSQSGSVDRPDNGLAEFLFAQAKDSLRALHRYGYLPAREYQTIKALLDHAHLADPSPPLDRSARGKGKSGDQGEKEENEEDLGKVNAWMRSTLEETSLIPTLVQSALTSAAPFLSGTQTDAIMQIVEESQGSIARAVTSPSKQQLAKHGAVTASRATARGVKSGFQASSTSIAEAREKTREKKLARSKVREEQHAVAEELAKEREWARKHLADRDGKESASFSSGTGSVASDHPTLSGASVSSSAEQKKHGDRLRFLEARDLALAKQAADQRQEDEDEEQGTYSEIGSAPGSSSSRRLPPLRPEWANVPTKAGAEATYASDHDSQGGSHVSAACIPLGSLIEGSTNSAHSAWSTTFSPWPGMILTQNLIVSSGTQSDINLANQASQSSRSAPEQVVPYTLSDSKSSHYTPNETSSPISPSASKAPGAISISSLSDENNSLPLNWVESPTNTTSKLPFSTPPTTASRAPTLPPSSPGPPPPPVPAQPAVKPLAQPTGQTTATQAGRSLAAPASHSPKQPPSTPNLPDYATAINSAAGSSTAAASLPSPTSATGRSLPPSTVSPHKTANLRGNPIFPGSSPVNPGAASRAAMPRPPPPAPGASAQRCVPGPTRSSAAAPPPPPPSSTAGVPRTTPPAARVASEVDETAPPPFGSTVDVTQTKKKGGWSRLLS